MCQKLYKLLIYYYSVCYFRILVRFTVLKNHGYLFAVKFKKSCTSGWLNLLSGSDYNRDMITLVLISLRIY
ncbi:hypothetical protein EQ875_00005 [Photobacterium damselae subsp. damselae]|uniref:Uncharacterized protein n=1 Tax=Photobacterium damselae TaxID=38293 RepID=A0A2X1W8T8_PHODM|nr:hypothetical protein EQ875_00005 [Photobacterium damselae subsp. damselae]SPY27418.1 Uncharacterised protein [Photobacterium damselae]